MEDIYNIKWHPGFYGSIEYILKLYKKTLFFDTEYVLSKESVVMDMLIINADDMSISIFRHSYPRELFKSLNELSAEIDEVYPGIYYVKGIINIPLQIVVTKRLEKGKFEALKILAPDADEDEVRKFISEIEGLEDKDDKLNADAVLQVSVSANRELYEKIRSENDMYEALKELMKDEIDKTVNEAVNETRKTTKMEALYNTAIKMLRKNEPISKIIEYTELSQDSVIELANSIGVSVIY